MLEFCSSHILFVFYPINLLINQDKMNDIGTAMENWLSENTIIKTCLQCEAGLVRFIQKYMQGAIADIKHAIGSQLNQITYKFQSTPACFEFNGILLLQCSVSNT